MQKDLWRKEIVIGIIVLFIGASVTPSISGNVSKMNDIKDVETRTINDAIQTNEEEPHTVSTIDWWPMFHHDLAHSGYSTSDAPGTNNVRWSYTTGDDVLSSPAVSDGKVYVGSFDNKVYCLDADDGSMIWNYTTGSSVWSSPAVSDGKVYVGSLDNKVYCFGDEGGNQLPTIYNPNPDNESTGVFITTIDWCVIIEDPNNDTFNWTIETNPNVGDNFGNDESNGIKSCSLSNLQCSTHYTIYVNATDGNGWTRETFWFETEEDLPPEIIDVMATPSSQITGGYVNITAKVVDNVAVDTVTVDISGPTLSIEVMTNIPGTDWYYYNATYTDVGTYDYFVWANDTSGNEATSGLYQFEITLTGNEPTIVSIDPSSQTVGLGETFDVSVYVDPGEPIRGINFDYLYFDETLIHANSVTFEGFFDPYATINSIDLDILEIDNVNGEIRNVSEFILGPSSVSVDGVWVNISFTAQEDVFGTSYLDLSGVIIANETSAEVPIEVNNGTVTTVAEYFNLTVNVIGNGTVYLDPLGSTYLNNTHVELTAVADTGWAFDQWNGDLSGDTNPETIIMNSNKTVNATFIDIAPPEITDVTMITSDPLDTEPGIGWENISCTVTDDTGVDEVKLILTSDIITEYLMLPGVGDMYYYNFTITTADEYTYHIWADDLIGNENTSTPQPFDLPTNWDVDMNGHCHFMDYVAVSMRYNDEGPPGWVREDVDNGGKAHFMDLIAISMHYGESWCDIEPEIPEEGDNNISVFPQSQTVGINENFDVSIYVEPAEPIMGINFDKLKFNKALIQVNSVTFEGFFDPYTTFSSSPVIDNVNGEIRNVYEFTIGGDYYNVNTAGVFVNISFTAQNALGTSYLDLSGVIIANETGTGTPIEVNNGTVTVEEVFDLTVSVVGNGTVDLDPPGGAYIHGTTVQLTANADATSVFTHWTGDLTGTTNPDTILMDDPKAVTAWFELAAAPPYVPSAPNPGDNATDVDIDADLSWTGGDPNPGDTITYDVYFGTTSPPDLVASDLSVTTYDPGTMEYETMYYWQIVADDGQRSITPGPIWSFTTGNEQTIVNIDPSAQIVRSGETFDVSVYVDPGEPIRGINFDYLYFDETLIHANSVTFEGFFDPYGTSLGTLEIDNVNGEIRNVSELILGPGSVSVDGVWVNISFTAQDALGTSELNLSGIIVKDAAGDIIPHEVNNGTVTVEEYFDLTISVVGNGTTDPAPGVHSYPCGTVVDLEAFGDSCWEFAGWSGDITTMDNPTAITMDSNKSVIATFTEIYYDLTVSVIGNGTTVPTAGVHSYPCGTVVPVEAFPDSCWEFAGWSGDITTMDNPTAITMDSNKSVIATFTEIYYDLTMIVVGSGTTTPAVGVHSFPCGTVVDLEAFPDPCWEFAGWSGDLTGFTNPDTIGIDDNKVVTATFIEKTIVRILPSSQIVGSNDTFNVSIYIKPAKPIINVSFDYLNFNSSLIHANNVIEGNLFDPYNTIFNSGTINNTNGTITDVYCYTDPVNNVTDIGYLCTISFTAQQNLGTSALDLQDVLIIDADYNNATTIIYDGEVTVIDNDAPEISNVQVDPSIQETGGKINISAVITDNIAVNEVFLNITYPDISIKSYSIKQNKTGDIYYCNMSYVLPGLYNYYIWAYDGYNSNFSIVDTFYVYSPGYVYAGIDFNSLTPGWGYDHFNCIQDAVDKVSSGGTIEVSEGTYTENIEINKSSTLKASSGSNPIIKPSGGTAINITAENVTIKELTIRNATVGVQIGAETCPNLISVNFNKIEGNTNYGLMNLNNSGTVNATRNWWNSIKGPYNSTQNPNGTGDAIFGNVEFNPWIGSAGGVIYSDQLQTNQTAGGNVTEEIDAMDLADTVIEINTATSTNVTVANYTAGSESISGGVTAVGRYIDVDVENEDAVNWPINIAIYYTAQDLTNANMTEDQIVGMYYWNDSANDWQLYNATGVNTTNVSIGKWYEGYVWAQALNENQLSPKIPVGDITPPKILDNTPILGYTGDSFTFNASIVDIFGVINASLEYWFDDQDHITVGMNNVADDYWEKTIIIPSGSIDLLHYNISANDTYNNWNNSGVKDANIFDNDDPIITDVALTTSDPIDTEPCFGWENFTCAVTDNTAVDEVKLVLVGNSTTEYPMTHAGGDNYYCNITISTADEYTYHIWANDTNRNFNTSISQPFNMPLNEDVDMGGKVHFMDLVAVARRYNDEPPNGWIGEPPNGGWIREDVDNNGIVHFMDLIAIARHYNEEW